MDLIKRRFMSTPLGVQERERNGTCVSRLKESLFGGRLAEAQSLYKRDLRGHFGCVNAIEFSTDGELIASGGDDRRLLLWNIGQTMFDDKAPHVIDTLHVSNINTCCFDADNRAVATGGNDGQVIVHDINVRQSTAVYGLSDAVYCLSPDPINSTIIATATDDGKAQIIDLRMSIDTAPFVLADLSTAMHSVMFNPAEPRLLATANSKHGIGLWDVRMPLKCLQYKSNVQNCMSVRFNSQGDQLVALRRRSSPVLYDIAKLHPIHEFDYKTYYNACTLKSCSFAGLKDEYVMSGSDDFCVYLWKIPSHISDNYTQSQPHMILKGHRSIVNQVRFCPYNQTIISSGVEKLIKLWSPYYIPGCTGHLTHNRRYGDDNETERNAYSHEEYIHMVLQAGSFLSHDYTNGSTEEEPCMIAFFDSLIQREIEQSVEGDDQGQDGHHDLTSHDDDSDGGQREAARPARVTSFSDDQQAASIPGQVRPSGDIVSSQDEVNSSSSTESEDASNTRDTSPSSSSRLEDSSRPFFLDLQSSSDSEGEVDVILSAMYSRYMSARERALNSNLRPSGKKISSVIAKGKQRDRTLQTKMRSHRRQRIRKNMTSMSILADVIDTFVDSLVATGPSNSQTLSDTNDGHLSTDSGGRDNSSTPVEVIQQTLTLHTDDMASATSSVATVPSLAQPAVTHDSAIVVPAVPVSLQPGMYFMPELEIFGPDSFNTARFANLPDAYLSGHPSRHIRPLDVSSRSRRWVVRPQPPAESAHSHTIDNSSSAAHSHTWDNSSSAAHIHTLDNSSAAQNSAVDGCISSNYSNSSGGGGRCGRQCSSTPTCVTKSGTSSRPEGASTCRHSGVTSDLVDQTSKEFNRQRMLAMPSTSAGEYNRRTSPPSSSSTRSRQHLGTLCSSDGTAGAPADASSNKPVSVQFKKAKVTGKRFRVHRSQPSSSSDED